MEEKSRTTLWHGLRRGFAYVRARQPAQLDAFAHDAEIVHPQDHREPLSGPSGRLRRLGTTRGRAFAHALARWL